MLFTALCALAAPSARAADSTVDPTFGVDGWKRLYQPGGGTQDERGVGFARTADGGFVVVVEVPGGAANVGTGKRIGLFRLDRNGVNIGFGALGDVYKDAWLTSVTAMTLDAQGRIVVVGATPGQGGLPDFGVVRFNADGTDDTGFAGDGGTSFSFEQSSTGYDEAPTSVTTDPDGRIVVAGNLNFGGSDHRVGIVRFDTDGSIDSTFGDISDGFGGRRGSDATFVSGAAAYAARILRVVDGYYLMTGTSVYSSTDTDFAARILTPSGSPWAGFVGSGTFGIDEPGNGGSLYDTLNDAVLVDPTTVLLFGTASGKFAATRIKISAGSTVDARPDAPGAIFGTQYADLALDPTFIGSAIPGRPYRYVGNTPQSDGRSAAVRSDGRILLVGGTASLSISGSSTVDGMEQSAGNSWARIGLVTRLDADGSPDAAFGISGSYAYAAPGGTASSYYTTFEQVRFDGLRPVMLGSAVDNSTVVSDSDAVITRLQSDVIFADGYEA
ncbi:hypothetical protein [Dokdonella sp.]|uniref:hypothetical protein n=1 Tax=Dokdonella sp. TaxID=2291710 RepID=UPI002F3F0849